MSETLVDGNNTITVSKQRTTESSSGSEMRNEDEDDQSSFADSTRSSSDASHISAGPGITLQTRSESITRKRSVSAVAEFDTPNRHLQAKQPRLSYVIDPLPIDNYSDSFESNSISGDNTGPRPKDTAREDHAVAVLTSSPDVGVQLSRNETCMTCKTSRSRISCDGQRPECGSCLMQNRTCSWAPHFVELEEEESFPALQIPQSSHGVPLSGWKENHAGRKITPKTTPIANTAMNRSLRPSIPLHLRQLLDAYTAHHGPAATPPCMLLRDVNEDLYKGSTKGTPTKWVTRHGEPLRARLDRAGLPRGCILIVEGVTQPAVIVKYFPGPRTARSQQRTAYYIWKGMDSWESEPSVYKVPEDYSMTSDRREKLPERALKTSSCLTCRGKHTRCDGFRPECDTCLEGRYVCQWNSLDEEPRRDSLLATVPSPKDDSTPSSTSAAPGSAQPTSLPSNLQKQLSEYYDRYGTKSLPECASKSDRSALLYTTWKESKAAQWRHADGARLTAKIHRLPNGGFVTYVQAPGKDPMIVGYKASATAGYNTSSIVPYLTWNGVHKYDLLNKPVIFKLYAGASLPNMQSTPPPSSTPLPRNIEPRRKSARTASAHLIASRTSPEQSRRASESRIPTQPTPPVRRSPNIARTSRGSAGLFGVVSPAQSPSTLHKISIEASILTPHQKNSTFINFVGGARGPRRKSIAVCNSIGSLFVQAAAAGLFNGIARNESYLLATVEGEEIPLVRDDKDDYGVLEDAIAYFTHWESNNGMELDINVIAAD